MASEDKPNSELHQAATELGHAGGEVGGPARARVLSAEDRTRIARKAAKARWAKAARLQKKPSQKQKPKTVKKRKDK